VLPHHTAPPVAVQAGLALLCTTGGIQQRQHHVGGSFGTNGGAIAPDAWVGPPMVATKSMWPGIATLAYKGQATHGGDHTQYHQGLGKIKKSICNCRVARAFAIAGWQGQSYKVPAYSS